MASGNDEVPLVVAFHGRGGNGETFFDITDMSTVAEERNFIAVFPTADFYQIRQDGLRSVRVWNGNYEGKQIDSEKFVRTMIEDIKGRHRVVTQEFLPVVSLLVVIWRLIVLWQHRICLQQFHPGRVSVFQVERVLFLITRNITSRTVTFLFAC